MASLFASQLRTIAQNSTHELDLRARRTAHASSLLFPPETAAKQDFQTIYAICLPGFRELCALDPTFLEFEPNLFSAQSVRTDREQMSQSENEALDRVLERALAMLGAKVLLKPGVKALEWLVRRFKVHTDNTAALLLAVLPWHELGIWRNVLSVVPRERCVNEWKFLGLYKEQALNVPRQAVGYAMSNNDGFFALLNNYVLENAREGIAHTGLLKFWSGLVVEAVVVRLDAARSGRKEVQRQRTEDLLLKVLPLLSDGLEVRNCADFTTACLTLAVVVAGKAELSDRVLDSLLLSVANAAAYPGTETKTVVVAMAVIVGQKQSRAMPKNALQIFITLSDMEATLKDLVDGYPVGILVEALVNGALSGMKRKNAAPRLAFLEKLLRFSNTLTQQVVSSAAQAVLLKISKLSADNEMEDMVRAGLIEILQRLNEERSISLAISEASQRLNQDSTQLEELLGSTVAMIEAKPETETDAMELDIPVSTNTNIDTVLEKVPTRTVDTVSFLAKHDRHLFDQLTEAFAVCCKSPIGWQKFTSLSIWESSQAQPVLLYSLLLRVAVGPLTSKQKSVALRLLAQNLKQLQSPLETQALLPYVLTALLDNVQSVRQSAAEVLIAMEAIAPAENTEQLMELDQLYDTSAGQEPKRIPGSHVQKMISQSLIPLLEECVLDPSQIGHAVQFALNGAEQASQTPTKPSQTELKKSLRHDLLELLTSHAVATPLFKVKLAVINLLRPVVKVGATAKSKLLAPLLEAWSYQDEPQATSTAAAEHMKLADIDRAMAETISPQDKDAFSYLWSALQDKDRTLRADLVTALFDHLQKVWKQLKDDVQVTAAQKLFDFAFGGNSAGARGAQGVLRSVDLSTDILGTILEQSTNTISQMQNGEQQPKKKRRTSHGRDSLPPDVARIVEDTSSRLTLALELIDDSTPEARPKLLPVLFETLSLLKRLKQSQRMTLPYLHNLCLTSILAIVDAQQKLPKPTIDISSIRADLVTDCIRTSDNPQVQTSALLLASSLASISPDRVLHNVMPIFTFMGQDMFSKDDEHSVHVINQAIDNIVPALVNSLRSQNKDLVKSTSGLLASFTTAFDHIPQHRRVATYGRLLARMGPKEFTYIVLAMLTHRKTHHSNLDVFFNELMNDFDAETQLLTVQNTIKLANDILSTRPQVAEEIFDGLGTLPVADRQPLARSLFKVALNILRSKSLKSQTSKLHRFDVDSADRLRTGIHACFSLILSTIRDRRRDGSDVVEEAKQCLDALLALPSLVELFSILPQAISSEDVDEDLKPQALRVLASQLHNNPLKDSRTRDAAMDLVSTLADMLQTDIDVALKQAIIVCIDKLCEVYGRKHVDTVVSAAGIVASDASLGSGDRRLEIMSLLSLASMLEVLKENCVAIVPELMPRITNMLRATVEQDSPDEHLHNAVFSLVAAIMSYVPFLVSDESLQALLIWSSMAAPVYNSLSAIESRNGTLSIIARKVDIASLLQALLDEDLNAAREHPEDAELEKLDMLSIAIETATKANVVRNADMISQLLLAHLDQRSRILSAGEAADEGFVNAVNKVEGKLNALSIQFIYKLNDSTFRPIFETWVDWANNAYDIESSAQFELRRNLRQTSLFGLLSHFFDTLKSIVTSYASYMIPMAHNLLSHTASEASSKKPTLDTHLYTNLLNMLQSTFTHDADAFYSAPSHFDPIATPLVSQLQLSSIKPFRSLTQSIIPTIVSLATATLDTPTHHQTISHALVQLRHSRSAAVRLASINTFAAITADENVGDEFIANVIGISSAEGGGARGIGGGGSVGEIMIYVNEMLEDDDEDVEREVRKWVQVVRERTGEDVFEV